MSTFVIAITGPTGAGKTTVSELAAKRLPRCVTIDADTIKHMVVGGFYVNPLDPTNPEDWGFNQWEIVGESIGLLAKNFLEHDFSVIINGYIDEAAWIALKGHVSIDIKILLLPEVRAVINRDAGRDATIRMGAKTVKVHHDHFSTDTYFDDFTVLDTTSQTTEETLEEVLRIASDLQ